MTLQILILRGATLSCHADAAQFYPLHVLLVVGVGHEAILASWLLTYDRKRDTATHCIGVTQEIDVEDVAVYI